MKAFLSLSKKQKDLIIETMEIMKSMLDNTKKEFTELTIEKIDKELEQNKQPQKLLMRRPDR